MDEVPRGISGQGSAAWSHPHYLFHEFLLSNFLHTDMYAFCAKAKTLAAKENLHLEVKPQKIIPKFSKNSPKQLD